MPFEQPPARHVEYVQVHVVTRRGGKRACGFGSEVEASGEADSLRMKGLQPRVTKRWCSQRTWETAPEFEGYV